MYKLKSYIGYRLRGYTTPAAGQCGRVKLKLIFWIAFALIVVYGAAMIIPPYFGYLMLRYEAKGVADVAHMYTDAQLESTMRSKAASWSIELEAGDIDVTRDYDEVEVSVNYSVTVFFFRKYEKTFYYDIHVVRELKQN